MSKAEQGKKIGIIGSPCDTFEAVIDILESSSVSKILGELVCFISEEDNEKVCSIGQITEIQTINKWHEEPSFKAVIKRHGSLPHLSGTADSRIAKLNIQSSFIRLKDIIRAHKLSNSPSTGTGVHLVTKGLIDDICKNYSETTKLIYLGKAYGSDVEIPFWFKHFGDSKAGGAGEAYHIGIFGRTGSGKTTTAARVLEGYSEHFQYMNILVLDPQGQFSNDNKLLPGEESFKKNIEEKGIQYNLLTIPDKIYFDSDPYLFCELLESQGMIAELFSVRGEYINLATLSLSRYLEDISENNSKFKLANIDARELLERIINKYCEENGKNRHMQAIYTQNASVNRVMTTLERHKSNLEHQGKTRIIKAFEDALTLFKKKDNSLSVKELASKITTKKRQFYILNLSRTSSVVLGSENIRAIMIRQITRELMRICEKNYESGNNSNCLIVFDEAHRYANTRSSDSRVKELGKDIIDAVRTTRKYGVGYMFVTQTIESLDDEIISQMRIFSFGYGLTMSKDFNKIKQIINDDNAAKFYRSFIDPSSSGQYPFMFHGPISPLSFTGSPLFIEMK